MLKIRINQDIRLEKETLFVVFGLAGMISCTLVVFITFFQAFFRGGTLWISINSFNEMYVELVLVFFMLASGFYAIIYYFNRVKLGGKGK